MANASGFSNCETPGLYAGNDERVDDVPELPCKGPVQVLENGTHHVLRGDLAGDSTEPFCRVRPRVPKILVTCAFERFDCDRGCV